jgi:hypothetical protein
MRAQSLLSFLSLPDIIRQFGKNGPGSGLRAGLDCIRRRQKVSLAYAH